MGDINFEVVSSTANSIKFQKTSFEGKISLGRGNTWATGIGFQFQFLLLFFTSLILHQKI
jgi:hypothetical protein